MDLSRHHPQLQVRTAAARTLVHFAGPAQDERRARIIQALREEIKEQDPELRVSAALSLLAFNSQEQEALAIARQAAQGTAGICRETQLFASCVLFSLFPQESQVLALITPEAALKSAQGMADAEYVFRTLSSLRLNRPELQPSGRLITLLHKAINGLLPCYSV